MNVLHLYDKARSQGLDAHELEWIEQTTRENPYFGLAYQISARHHLAEKTTVKDRALLLGATYAYDRNLLHSYVSDTFAIPKHAKGVSIVQVPVDEPAKDEVASVQEVVPAADMAEPGAVVPDAPVAIAEPELAVGLQADPIDAVSEALVDGEPVAVISAQGSVEPVLAELAVILPAIAIEPIKSEVAEIEPANVIQPIVTPAPQEAGPQAATVEASKTYPDIGINWFLNMRLKLRSSRFASMDARIRASIATHATQYSTSQAPAPDPKAVLIAEPFIPLAEKQERTELPPVPASPIVEKSASPFTPKGPEPKADTEYAIGSFSSFTFLRDDDHHEANETEMEALVMEPESMAVEASLADDRSGEMIFEEDGRRIEIVISPELRARFFKGPIPFELNSGPIDPPLAKSSSKRGAMPKEIAAPLQPANEADRRRKAQELMDRFIEVDPTMPKLDAARVQAHDLGKVSSVDRDDWVTETLAKIYAQQGNRSKAIKIYQKLSLLFPEKRDYFASRIAELK